MAAQLGPDPEGRWGGGVEPSETAREGKEFEGAEKRLLGSDVIPQFGRGRAGEICPNEQQWLCPASPRGWLEEGRPRLCSGSSRARG